MNDSEKFTKPFKISIPKSLIVALITVICLQFSSAILNLPSQYFKELFHLTLPVSFLLGGGIAIYILLNYVETTWKDILESLWKPSSLAILFLSILLYLFLLPFVEFVSSMVPTQGIPFLEEFYKKFLESFEIMLDYKIAGFITVCILAPILEEIIFRGILLRGLLQNGTSPVFAIFLSSVLFGLAHLNPWQFFGAGMLGAVFGFIYYRTKSLWICIFLHALNNMISFIFMLYYGTMDETVSNTNNSTFMIILFVGAIFVGWTLKKLTQNKEKWT